jgi:arginine decarboxylase
MEKWSVNNSAKIYNIDNWGAELFSINKLGHVCVHPSPNAKSSIDLKVLVDDLIKRKIKPPILLRFMPYVTTTIPPIIRPSTRSR